MSKQSGGRDCINGNYCRGWQVVGAPHKCFSTESIRTGICAYCREKGILSSYRGKKEKQQEQKCKRCHSTLHHEDSILLQCCRSCRIGLSESLLANHHPHKEGTMQNKVTKTSSIVVGSHGGSYLYDSEEEAMNKAKEMVTQDKSAYYVLTPNKGWTKVAPIANVEVSTL